MLFINDLPDSIAYQIKLYADDSKIIGIVRSQLDCVSLQADIDAAVNWSQKWLMPFNIDKCKVMHVMLSIKSIHEYTMTKVNSGQSRLEATTVERDLGVLVTEYLSVREQVEAAAATANIMLDRLKKTIRSRGFKLWRTLYLTYIRLHLKFAVQAWSPHLKGDIAIT